MGFHHAGSARATKGGDVTHRDSNAHALFLVAL